MFRNNNHHLNPTTPTKSPISHSISPLRRWYRKHHHRSETDSGEREADEEAAAIARIAGAPLMPELHEELPIKMPATTAITTHKSSNVVSPLRLFRSSKQQHRSHRRFHSAPLSSDDASVLTCGDTEYDAEESIPQVHRADLRVGRVLGEGGFARVFNVEMKKHNGLMRNQKNKLALKQLRYELLKDKVLFGRAAQSLVQEASIMRQLRGHQNILQLRGISGDADSPMPTKCGLDAFFLVTDALKETMADRIAKWSANKGSPAQQQERWMYSLNYSLQIAQALAFCHEQRIIYRDCKCDNVGFIDEHTIQLFDFGLARVLPQENVSGDDETVTSSLDSRYEDDEVCRLTICGTQRWMAPEVYNRGWYSTKADVYSWSMTVVELLTRKKPYSFMSLPVHKVLVLESGARPSVGELPNGLQLILQKAWAQNIADRWNMAQVCAALEAYMGSECSQQQPDGIQDRQEGNRHTKENALLAVFKTQQPQPDITTYSNVPFMASAA